MSSNRLSLWIFFTMNYQLLIYPNYNISQIQEIKMQLRSLFGNMNGYDLLMIMALSLPVLQY